MFVNKCRGSGCGRRLITPAYLCLFIYLDGDYVEVGEVPEEQHKSLVDHNKNYGDAIALAEKGELDKVKELYPQIYLRYLNVLRSIVNIDLAYVGVRGVIISGPPGIGKTRAIRAAFPDLYEKMLNKWWDGYEAQDVVFMDELEHDHVKYMGCNLKRWLDGYSFRAEFKGGSRMINPKMFIICTNYDMDTLFTDDILRSAIKRRLKLELNLFEEPITWHEIRDKVVFAFNDKDGTARTVLPARSAPDPVSQVTDPIEEACSQVIQPCCFAIKPDHANYCVCQDG